MYAPEVSECKENDVTMLTHKKVNKQYRIKNTFQDRIKITFTLHHLLEFCVYITRALLTICQHHALKKKETNCDVKICRILFLNTSKISERKEKYVIMLTHKIFKKQCRIKNIYIRIE